MRISLLFLIIALAFCPASARSKPVLSLSGGFKMGFGADQFVANPHKDQPASSSTNLFSILAPSSTLSEEQGFSGGLGLFGNASFWRVIDLQAELWWVSRNAKETKDLGSGIKQVTQYQRQVGEGNLLFKLGWPFELSGKNTLRPLVSGGAYGSRIVNAPTKTIGLEGESGSKTRAWEGVPNEDWGWVYGAGFEFSSLGAKGRGLTVGLEARYYDGQKDLDPKGVNDLRSKMFLGILSFGF